MRLIVTPRQLEQRADWYHQLGTMLAAGVPMLSALEVVSRDRSGLTSPRSQAMRQAIEQGATFVEAVARQGDWVPEFDRALLVASEQSGRLDSGCRSLGEHYRERARMLNAILRELIYPAFLLHFALFIGPLPALVLTGNLVGYLGGVLGVLLPIYLVVVVLVVICQGRHAEWWRAWVETVGNLVPMLGRARRELALSRLAECLEALVTAGVSVVCGWKIASEASGSPALRGAVEGWSGALREGQAPGELIGGSPVFPEMFASLYRTGEISGQLDQTLRHLAVYYREEGVQRLRLFATWLPRLIYLVIVGWVSMQILSAWSGIFSGYGEVLGE